MEEFGAATNFKSPRSILGPSEVLVFVNFMAFTKQCTIRSSEWEWMLNFVDGTIYTVLCDYDRLTH